ncbi:MAG: hypothetical protein JRG82_19690 [Deltaproteobacteria bacterium]|nr:hypothetical protein [Deltaproteobacteria bacterium]
MTLFAPRLLPLVLTTLVLCGPTSAQRGTPVAVVLAADADAQEELAAHEVRRYGYLRTGSLLPIVRCTAPNEMPADLTIVVGNRDRSLVRALLNEAPSSDLDVKLGPQDHLLTLVKSGGHELLVLTGGSSTATLYAAYRFVELLGVRFYLHGDTIPDGRCDWPRIEAPLVSRPLFDLRGIHPFHDFRARAAPEAAHEFLWAALLPRRPGRSRAGGVDRHPR